MRTKKEKGGMQMRRSLEKGDRKARFSQFPLLLNRVVLPNQEDVQLWGLVLWMTRYWLFLAACD